MKLVVYNLLPAGFILLLPVRLLREGLEVSVNLPPAPARPPVAVSPAAR